MKSKGWQRLWAVVSVVWSVGFLWYGAYLFANDRIGGSGYALFALVWLAPIIATYPLPAAIAWVLSGFREDRIRNRK
jgi:hypothetical protein